MGNILHGVTDPCLAFAHHGSGFGPGCLNIGKVERVEELSLGTLSRMGDQVRLGKVGGGHIPVFCFYRDVMFEQRPRSSATVEFLFEVEFVGFESVVDGSRADGEQLLLEGGRQVEASSDPRQPQGQQGHQRTDQGYPVASQIAKRMAMSR